MRVAIDATPLLGLPTGVGAFVRGALAGLRERDDVAMQAYALSWRGGRHLGAAVPAGVAVVDRRLPAGLLLAAWRRADRPAIERWTGPVDVVHGTNFAVPPARRAGRVVTVHDLTPVRFPELCTRATLRYPALLRRAIRRGALVHAVSSFVAAEVVEHLGATPDRVVVVSHGLPPSAPADPAAGRRVARADRYVLALGTVEPRKDLPSLVRAFDLVAAARDDLHLVVAGPDGWGTSALDAAVRAAHHRRRIRRVGWVSEEDKAALLRGATVFAFPSRYEGFGFPPLEAMAAGVPVVATRAGALPETLGDAAVLVPVGDHDALAEALAGVLDDDERRAALLARGARRVSELDWDRCAAGLVELYSRAAAAAA